MTEKGVGQLPTEQDGDEKARLPDELSRALEETRDVNALFKRDAKLDRAISDASSEYPDLGERLLKRSHQIFEAAGKAVEAGERPVEGSHVAAVRAAEAASQVFAKQEDAKEKWAQARFTLCCLLHVLGSTSQGAVSRDFFARAVEAGEDAIRESPKGDPEGHWVAAQVGLSHVLHRMSEDEKDVATARAQLERAAEAARQAQSVHTRKDHPREWSKLQTHLGQVLMDLIDMLPPEDLGGALEGAAEVIERALEVLDRKIDPQEWAQAHELIARVCNFQGMTADGGKARALFSRSVKALESALQVIARADDPHRWAKIQGDLGMALHGQALRGGDGVAGRLNARAVDAYETALKVFTPEESPAFCSIFSAYLSNTLFIMASTVESQKKALRLLARSADALETAIRIQERGGVTSELYANRTMLAGILQQQAMRSSEKEIMPLLTRAAEVCDLALTETRRSRRPKAGPPMSIIFGNIVSELAVIGGNSKKVADLRSKAVRLLKDELKAFGWGARHNRSEKQELLEKLQNAGREVSNS